MPQSIHGLPPCAGVETIALLSFQKVAKAFGGIPVLHGIDLKLRKGEVVALVGENGAGKSTLMRIAAGLMPKFRDNRV